MALGKGAYAIHQSGRWFTNENIDQLLMERHINKKARMSSRMGYGKSQKKRAKSDDIKFQDSFEKLVMTSLYKLEYK